MIAKNDITRLVKRGWPEAADTTSDIGRTFASGSPASIDATAARADGVIKVGLSSVRTINVIARPSYGDRGAWASGT